MRVVMHRPDGTVYVKDGPAPECGPRQVLVAGAYGWISSGTESGFLRKMRAQRSKDPKDYWLGYTASGTVLRAGAEAPGFEPGMPVAIYGSPHVYHATELPVGRNLAVPVPPGVPLWAAASAGLGAIALHGLRQINVTFGDVIVHYGLGPVGMLAVQLAEAMGATVIASDLSPERVAALNGIMPGRAHVAGQADLKALALEKTRGRGADAVVLAISGPKAVEDNLADLLRIRGRVSLLGGSDEFPKLKDAARKELDVKFVHAGGPGRRDPQYEVEGVDYPAGYVPWTEARNMEAFLRAVAAGKVQIAPLVSHCFPIDAAPAAWDLVVETPQKTLGVLVDLAPGQHPAPPARGDMC